MSRTLIAIAAAATLLLAGCSQATYETSEEAAVGDNGSAQGEATRARQAAPARKEQSTIAVPAGTIIDVRLDHALDSGENATGDRFTARVIRDVRSKKRNVIPAGSTIHGMLQEVRKAKRGAGRAKLVLAFTRLELRSRYSTPMVASLSEQSESQKKRNAAVIGGSAAGGAVLGRILGKDTKGAVVGSIVGGAIGTGVVMAQKGEQAVLPAGTELAVKLDEEIRVPD